MELYRIVFFWGGGQKAKNRYTFLERYRGRGSLYFLAAVKLELPDCEMYQEERDVLGDEENRHATWRNFGSTLDNSEKSIAILHGWWPQRAK